MKFMYCKLPMIQDSVEVLTAAVCWWAPGACFGLQANAVGLAAALGSCQGQWLQSLSLQRWADGEIEVRLGSMGEGFLLNICQDVVIFSEGFLQNGTVSIPE